MKDIFKAIKNILFADWTALVAIFLLSVILKWKFDFSIILCLIVLLVIYFLLGCVIEYIMQSYKHYKKVKSGKSEEQLKREAEIRERRRARGMEMLSEKQKNDSEKQSATDSTQGYVRRRRAYTPYSDACESKEYEKTDVYGYGAVGQSKRKKSPFDVAPPPEDIKYEDSVSGESEIESDISDIVEESTEFDIITEDEFSSDAVSDDVYVNTETLDALYDAVGTPNVEEGSIDADNMPIEKSDEVVAKDVSCENSVEENVISSEQKSEVHSPMSVHEIQQTSADLSQEIKNRVNTHRRRSHIIFDAYNSVENTTAAEDTSLDDVPAIEKSIDYADNSDDFDNDDGFVDDNIPTTDSVDADQDKLDELYSEKTTEEVKKNKVGFFSRAISGFKKKRNSRNKR